LPSFDLSVFLSLNFQNTLATPSGSIWKPGLRHAPYGVRDGVLPILLVLMLQEHQHEIE
jgi:hypothetical protein